MSVFRWVVVSAFLAACGGGGGGTDAATSSDGGGNGGDGGLPTTAPKLIARTPGPTADFWQRAPITLTFDQPLDPTTVNDNTVTLEIDGTPVPLSISLSADHTVVTATFDPVQGPTSGLISATSNIKGENGLRFSELDWGFDIPLWRSEILGPSSHQPAVTTTGDGDFLVARIEAGALYVEQATEGDDTFSPLGAPGALVTAPEHPAIAVVGGQPIVAVQDGTDVRVLGYDAGSWTELQAITGAQFPRLAVSTTGTLYASWLTGGTVVVSSWDGSSFSAMGSPITAANVSDLVLAAEGDHPLVAFENGAGNVAVWAYDTSDFVHRATFARTDGGPSQLAAASASDRAYLAWIDADSRSSYTRITSWNPNGSRIEAPNSLEIDPAGDAAAPALAVAADGSVHAAWIEGGPSPAVFVARYTSVLNSGRLQVMGGAVLANPAGVGALAVAADGDDAAAWITDDGITVARWNASPEAPHGLAARAMVTTCAIPADGAGFPQTLTDTGCYSDVASQTVAPEVIPYDVRSPLWSDGAIKRRFMIIPNNQTIGYTATGAWTLPVGTILMKEFWIEAVTGDPSTLIPMETRFLVKRCQPGNCTDEWQGYSYQWNTSGTEGTLLAGTATTTFDWTVMDGGSTTTHTHIYPARTDCVRCHNAAAGRTLGLQTVQLARPMRYGEVVDDELRALDAIGIFGGTLPATPTAGLPRPADPVPGNYRRSRAYFHANCSHCHRPGGEKPTVDFRFETALVDTGICAVITPGDSANSTLYQKDASRTGGQMPPIATLLPDPIQLPVTAAWIDSLTTCP